MLFPDIDPVLVQIGPFAIRWYALAYITGLIGGWYYARRLCQVPSLWGLSRSPSLTDLDDMVLYVALGVVLGGRLGYVMFYNAPFYLENPSEALAIWHGGMSFHGGLTGAAVAIFIFARRRVLSALSLLDVAAVVAPIGLFFGRIANFINGELWGRVTFDFPYAIIFPAGGPLPRHPSQLYEAVCEGLLLFIVMGLLVRRFGFRKPGFLTGCFGTGYALARIFCEFFREPDAQLGYLIGTDMITMGMVLSLPMLVLGMALIIWSSRKARA